jgi:hypothetical protein
VNNARNNARNNANNNARNTRRNTIINVRNKIYSPMKSQIIPKSNTLFSEDEGYYGNSKNYRPYRSELSFPYVAKQIHGPSTLRANAKTFVPPTTAYQPLPTPYQPLQYPQMVFPMYPLYRLVSVGKKIPRTRKQIVASKTRKSNKK